MFEEETHRTQQLDRDRQQMFAAFKALKTPIYAPIGNDLELADFQVQDMEVRYVGVAVGNLLVYTSPGRTNDADEPTAEEFLELLSPPASRTLDRESLAPQLIQPGSGFWRLEFEDGVTLDIEFIADRGWNVGQGRRDSVTVTVAHPAQAADRIRLRTVPRERLDKLLVQWADQIRQPRGDGD
jgi:hypothetical protein